MVLKVHKNHPFFPICCNCVFDKFILADEPFAKALRSFEKYLITIYAEELSSSLE